MTQVDHLSVVWKFPLEFGETTEHRMPAGARVLAAHVQAGRPTLWAAVNPESASESRRFGVYATGEPLPVGPKSHVGTVLVHGGTYVFHVFELGSPIRRLL